MMDIFSAENRKRFTSNCLNRELKSHQRNCVQDRLLQECNNRFDRNHLKESKTQRYIREGIKKDHGVIVSRTPSVSEWMRQHQNHLDAWKERERQRLESKHKYSIRKYKVPMVVSLDSDGMQMSFNGSDPIGKVQDPEEIGGDVCQGDSNPLLRRTISDAGDRPKTASVRRRGTIHIDTRPAGYPRRCASVAQVEDWLN